MKVLLLQTLLLLVVVVVGVFGQSARLNRYGRLHNAHPCVSQVSCGVHDFARSKRVAPTANHTVTFWLRQNNIAADCPALLEKVSNPESAQYGNYYTFDQIKELVWDEEAIESVSKFLLTQGISNQYIAPNGEYIRVTTSVDRLESALKAEFYEFRSPIQQKTITRSFAYTIPSRISKHVHFVASITDFPMYSRRTQILSFDSKRALSQQGFVVPNTIFQLYNLPNRTDPTPKADQSVFESLGQSFDPADLTTFEKLFNLPQNPIKQIIGPNNPADCLNNPGNCAEASLDVQWIMALAWGAPTVYWSIPAQGDIFLTFLEQIAANPTPPQVYSISYGGPEHLQNPASLTQFNTEACKAGLRGLTFFASSGDDGVAGFEARNNAAKCGFNPEFPALSPFVTAVGATMGPENGNPEIACTSKPGGSIITTGGGFSALFARPTYQDAAVQAYLANTNVNLPPLTMFNSKGRAFPDIAALGNSFITVIGGQKFLLSGTSASSPVFCAMVTLINGQREAAGKKPLGFLNPLLYSTSRAGIFNDINSGINNCCAGQNPVCCQFGFTAAAGWDPLTGLGSIDFLRLSAALDNLP